MEQFLKLIENEFRQYRNFVIRDKIFDNIKIKITNIILYSPNQNNSFLSSFEDIYPYQPKEYTKILEDLYTNFRIKGESLVYTVDHIDESILKNIKDSLDKKKNFIYLYKNGKHLTNLVNKIRNSLAHGNFYILEQRVVMWNISKQNNITFFANIRLYNFKYFHDVLIKLIVYKNS